MPVYSGMHRLSKLHVLRALVLACPALTGCFNPTSTPDADTDGAVDTSSDTTTASTEPSSTSPSSSSTEPSSTSPSSTDSDPSDTDPSDTDPSDTDPSDTDPSDTDPSGSSSDTDPSDTDPSGSSSDTDPTSEGTDSDTSVTGDPSCDGQCAPEVPQGWQGPIVINDGADPVPCPGEFPQTVHDNRFTGLQEGAATCNCACGDVSGASCGAATLREEGNLCIQFIQNPDTYVLNPGACVFANASADDYSLSVPTLNSAGASCAPQATEQIEDPSWDRELRACGTAAGDACEGGNCFPAIPEDYRMCIWFEGEVGCPGGPWSETVVTYADATDDRDCTQCTCDTPQGTCGGSAILTNQGCGVVFVDEMPVGGCGNVQGFTHAQYTAEIDASCAPSGGDLTGDVTPSGAITYCCI